MFSQKILKYQQNKNSTNYALELVPDKSCLETPVSFLPGGGWHATFKMPSLNKLVFVRSAKDQPFWRTGELKLSVH